MDDEEEDDDDDNKEGEMMLAPSSAPPKTPARKAPKASGAGKRARQGSEGKADGAPTATGGGKKPKVRKDPHAPKKALSAYHLWCQAARREAPFSSLSFADQSKALGAAWKALDVSERAPWVSAAAKDKAHYEHEMKSYVPPPVRLFFCLREPSSFFAFHLASTRG